MEQFVVSARKYRPVTFDSVVGQSHIGDTLKNAIRSNHLAQAFLFAGPRGVGKTTCARILAKTINCMNRTGELEACDQCDSCKSFNEGHSLNIYELDAASNNSVDDIRKLIEQVRFAPQIGTKKVYIIDEVHMLSAAAFNAFLKTLEEPPSHAIFILATTEKHKVIPTILSRCQVFEFNRIEVDDIVRRLEEIAEKEKVNVEAEALHLIAIKGDGSLRDALTIFDQMVTYSSGNLTYQKVIENLGILDTEYFFRLTDFLVSGETASALRLFDEVLQNGFDAQHFLLEFADHFRNLLVAQDHRTIELIQAGKSIREKYAEQTTRVSSGFLINGLNALSKAEQGYKSARNQRLLVELVLINLSAGNSPEPQPAKSLKPAVETASAVTPLPKKKPESTVGSAAKTEEPEITATAPVEPVKTEPEPAPATAIQDIAHEEPIDKKPILDELEKKVQSAEPKRKNRYNPDVIGDTISIKDFTEPKAGYSSDNSDDPSNLQRSEITPEGLESAWKKLLEQVDKAGKLNLYSTLMKYPTEMENGEIIVITYDNQAQVEIINSERQRIVDFLRKKLKNDHLNIRLKVSDKQYQKAYTPSEKLQKMIENNPNISELKERLDLDLGH